MTLTRDTEGRFSILSVIADQQHIEPAHELLASAIEQVPSGALRTLTLVSGPYVPRPLRWIKRMRARLTIPRSLAYEIEHFDGP